MPGHMFAPVVVGCQLLYGVTHEVFLPTRSGFSFFQTLSMPDISLQRGVSSIVLIQFVLNSGRDSVGETTEITKWLVSPTVLPRAFSKYISQFCIFPSI